jgi:hypothetical protein
MCNLNFNIIQYTFKDLIFYISTLVLMSFFIYCLYNTPLKMATKMPKHRGGMDTYYNKFTLFHT